MMDRLTIAIGQINTRDVAVLVSRLVVNGMTVGSHARFWLKALQVAVLYRRHCRKVYEYLSLGTAQEM